MGTGLNGKESVVGHYVKCRHHENLSEESMIFQREIKRIIISEDFSKIQKTAS